MKSKIGILGVVVVAVAACSWAQSKQARDAATPTSYPVDTEVTFDVSAQTVRPSIALLPTGASLQLKVTGLAEGQSLEINFRAQGGKVGPFAKTSANVRGRYVFTNSNPLPSGPVDVTGDAVWKFDVILRDKGQADVWAIDPVIVVKN
jgi:hypothetical protein